MSLLRMIYLALAIWGAVHPMYYMVQWVTAQGWGFDPAALIDAWTVNQAARAVFWDLVIAGTALTVFIVAEVAVRRNWLVLIAIPVTFGIGVSCGLPLYLFLRSRPVR